VKRGVIVLGSVAYDDIQTPYGRVSKVLGGSGSYIGVVASYYDIFCSLVSKAGRDFSDQDRFFLEKSGVDLQNLEIDGSDNTLFWSGVYDQDNINRHTRETKIGVFNHFDPDISKQLSSPYALILGNIDPVIQLKVLEKFSLKPKITLLDTMDYWIQNRLDSLMEIIQKVDILSINNQEAYNLTKKHHPKDAASELLKLGVKFVIIKLGEYGSFIYSGDNSFYMPCYPISVAKDPTGAGDCFLGGFAGYLTQTGENSFDNMKLAMQHGTVMASFIVEDFGLKNLSQLNKENFSERFQYLTKLIQTSKPPKSVL